ncbi:MAG TPA: SAM-dependent methyltransferase [Burkholderiaceae bacterium]|nr:SAM-dependent methyltransferase [Burkholderiaceae bacterium]
MNARRNGTLVLVPNSLDLGTEAVDLQEVLPLGALRRAAGLRRWVAENAKTTRAFLKRVSAVAPLAEPLQSLDIRELPRPRKGGPQSVDKTMLQALLQPALAGEDVGLISEAGLPAVADPGAALVEVAHALGIPVLPLPGPSSLMLALAASGLNGQSFAFVGYLPVEAPARAARLRELQSASKRHAQTQLIIETPYRNQALLSAMLETLADDTRLSVSCGLTLQQGWTRSQPVRDWKREGCSMPDKVPAVFALLAP